MSYTFVETSTTTFTITHARQISSKIGADLKRLQDFYFAPSDQDIGDYETEAAVLLKHDVLDHVTYGFRRNGQWTLATLRYEAKAGAMLGAGDDPGRIPRGVDVSGASFHSFLSYNSRWFSLSDAERRAIKNEHPVSRGTGDAPQIEGGGVWASDRNYVAAGRGVARSKITR